MNHAKKTLFRRSKGKGEKKGKTLQELVEDEIQTKDLRDEDIRIEETEKRKKIISEN